MSKHTPGPWHFVPWHIEEGQPAVRCAEGWIVATASTDADAEFIARAPAMEARIAELEAQCESAHAAQRHAETELAQYMAWYAMAEHQHLHEKARAERAEANAANWEEQANDRVSDWDEVRAERDALRAERRDLIATLAAKDAAYLERNQCVSLIATMAHALGYWAGTAHTAIEGWSDDWHGCIYIDLPTGQVSWHYHDSQAHLFAHLPPYCGVWDGHDTAEKYRRVLHRPIINARAERAEAALRQLGKHPESCGDDCVSELARLDVLAERDALRADAERFAWYFGSEDKMPFMKAYIDGLASGYTLDQWRAAIDAAMERADET